MVHLADAFSKGCRLITDDAGAQARLENGVLMFTLPKKEPAQPKKIMVR
jgi:HSP20 family molecular chaperone IbpA